MSVQDEIASFVEHALRDLWPEVDPDAACLYKSLLGAAYARERFGLELEVHAGTAFWPRLEFDERLQAYIGDDGVEPHRFGYMFEMSDVTVRRLIEDKLPEMHVWLYCRETREIVDFAAGCFPAQCRKMQGYEWKREPPPRYWWGRHEDLPATTVYEHDPLATSIAREMMMNTMKRTFAGGL